MINTIQPLGKNILIIPHEEEVKPGTILRMDKRPAEFHKVIAIGEDVTKVNKGDLAIVNFYHVDVYRHPEFMIVDESAIVGVKHD